MFGILGAVAGRTVGSVDGRVHLRDWMDWQSWNPAPLTWTAAMEQSQWNHEYVKSVWEEPEPHNRLTWKPTEKPMIIVTDNTKSTVGKVLFVTGIGVFI